MEKNIKDKIGIKKGKKSWYIICATLVVAICTAVLCGNHYYQHKKPCAITIDGTPICYVKNSEEAKQTINRVLENNTPKDTVVKAVNTNGRLKVCKVSIPENTEAVDVDTAVTNIETAMKEDSDNGFVMTVASAMTEVRNYTPEPYYKKDDSMYAGESRVEREGKDGKQKVAVTYVTRNGEIIEKKEITAEVIDEGEKATVYKGTRGLPEGENWQTYNGDPVPTIGNKLVEDSMAYMGVPYSKWDCVSFVRNMYAKHGIILPRSKAGIRSFGAGVSYENAKKGDIICYSGHVGIYIGNGKMIHSISAKGVSIGKVVPSKILTVRRYVK